MEISPVAPALRVTATHRLRKTRLLPVDGDVLVDAGERVGPDDVIARLRKTSPPLVLNLAQALGTRDAGEVARCLLKSPGDTVRAGELLAEKRGAMRFGHRSCASPIDGVVASGPTSWGELLINPLVDEVEVRAAVSGLVVGTIPARGAVIETTGAYVQGLAAAGEDARGILKAVVASRGDEIVADSIDESCSGAVLFGGHVGQQAVRTATLAGVQAVIVGSVTGPTFRWLLDNPQPLAVVVTDAFGTVPMSLAAFELLTLHVGRVSSVFAPLETSWGVAPPEVIVPDVGGPTQGESANLQLREGALVRITRGNHLGAAGRVSRLPAAKGVLKSGIRSKLVEVEIGGGSKIVVGRHNVELVG
ncbi:MAG: hypothetical protein HY675_02920 [Chloroflexi bacterium]|nr:hypothetical protein [Chloroflexota bacterium]